MSWASINPSSHRQVIEMYYFTLSQSHFSLTRSLHSWLPLTFPSMSIISFHQQLITSKRESMLMQRVYLQTHSQSLCVISSHLPYTSNTHAQFSPFISPRLSYTSNIHSTVHTFHIPPTPTQSIPSIYLQHLLTVLTFHIPPTPTHSPHLSYTSNTHLQSSPFTM